MGPYSFSYINIQNFWGYYARQSIIKLSLGYVKFNIILTIFTNGYMPKYTNHIFNEINLHIPYTYIYAITM